ncbi:unnamed protein product [Phaeothamnion confervicola]
MLALKILNTNLTYHLNNSDFSSVADFFTEQAVYREGDRDAVGPERIVLLLEETLDLGVRQIFTDPYLHILNEGKARGCFLRVVFSRVSGNPSLGSISDVMDEYELCVDQCWRISRRAVTLVF